MRTIKPSLDLVIDADNYLGETPVWAPAEQALYWVNCEQEPELHRWDARSGDRRIWPMPQRIGGFVLKDGGGALLVLADGLYDMDLESGTLSLKVKSPLVHAALHECQCDRQGRFWVGSIDHRIGKPDMLPGGGAFFRLEGDHLIEMFDGVSCSNGLAFSPDGHTLYHSDSPTAIVHAWDLDPVGGVLSNRREFIRLRPGEGFCDGATVDAEGGYWATLVFGSRLRRYLPDGTPDIEVELPFNAPTKLAYGGADLDTLYITTNKMRPEGPGADMLGGIYAFRPGFRGVVDPMLPRVVAPDDKQ